MSKQQSTLPTPEWRRATYYCIYPALYPEGKQFPLGMAWGGGWGGCYCYCCWFKITFVIHALKTWREKRGGGRKKKPKNTTTKNHLLPRSVRQLLLGYLSAGYDPSPSPAGPHRSPGPGSSAGTRQGWVMDKGWGMVDDGRLRDVCPSLQTSPEPLRSEQQSQQSFSVV